MKIMKKAASGCKKYHLDLFLKIMLKFRKLYIISLVISAASLILSYILPLVNIMFIDKGIIGKDIKTVFISIFIMAGINIVREILKICDTKFTYYFRYRLESYLKTRILNYCIYQSYTNENSGEYHSLIKRDSECVLSLSQTLFKNIFINAVSVIFSVFMLIKIQPLLAFPVLLLQIIFVSVRLRTRKQEEENGHIARSTFVYVMSVLNELVNNIRSIALLGAGPYAEKRFSDSLRKDYDVQKKNTMFSTKIHSIVSGGMNISSLLMLCVGGILVIVDKMTMGKLITFNQYTNSISDPLITLLTMPAELSDELASVDKIAAILEYEEKHTDHDIGEISDITIEDLTFSYGNNIIFRKADACFKKGSVYYLEGKSGSGKTTFINIILGLYNDFKGSVTINGVPIQQIDTYSKMEMISLVTQNSVLFNDTVGNNITLGDTENISRIDDICRCCCIYDDIDRLPDKYQTVIAENGKNFSGGQKSRICLARALYQNKPIIIIDEVTAGLDRATETKLRKNLEKYIKDKIVIIITHSKNFIIPDSRIYRIENNKVV